MQAFQILVDDFYFCIHIFRAQQLAYFVTDLLCREWLIDALHKVLLVQPATIRGVFAIVIYLLDDAVLTRFAQQRNGCLKGDEVAHAAHVNAVAIGVADLRRGGYDDDFLRPQAVQHLDDAFAQRGAAHDGVINHHQRVNAGADGAVGNVVHVLHHLGAAGIFGDEGAHLHVFDGNLLNAHAAANEFQHILIGHLVALRFEALQLNLVQPCLHAFDKAVEGSLRGIWDKGDDGVLQVVIDGLEHGWRKVAAKLLALFIDVGIGAAGEVNALKGAGMSVLSGCRICGIAAFAFGIDDDRMAGLSIPALFPAAH